MLSLRTERTIEVTSEIHKFTTKRNHNSLNGLKVVLRPIHDGGVLLRILGVES